MRIRLWAYGRIGSSAEAELVDRYRKRLSWDMAVTELREGATLPWPGSGDAKMILLDERGEALNSAAFARRIGTWRDEGVRELHFALGPADGFSDEQRRQADLLLAFGSMTWPHLLARAMLAEQLYRAASILSGHPYHREG
jgi:23S rRNA (pseudouridine1915-N3)-methyltransferase